MEAGKVFGCDDLRGEILSYLQRRCLHCHKKMNKKYRNSYKYYWLDNWKRSESGKMKNYCNWCVYYVFEYS